MPSCFGGVRMHPLGGHRQAWRGRDHRGHRRRGGLVRTARSDHERRRKRRARRPGLRLIRWTERRSARDLVGPGKAVQSLKCISALAPAPTAA
jgi:hypothetical protein